MPGRLDVRLAKRGLVDVVGALRRCPFVALWMHQRAANGSKGPHKAKVKTQSDSTRHERDPATSNKRRKVRLTPLFPPVNRRVAGSNPA